MRLFIQKLVRQRALVIMSVPFLIWLFIFKYVPIWGWTIAFQDYKPALGFWEQTWIGLDHFQFLFGDERFIRVLRNTLAMSSINLIFGFVTAIGLALLLNEIRRVAFKRVVQTVSYLPHFISWVVAASIIQTTLAPDGIINQLLKWLGTVKEGNEILFLGIPEYFWTIFGASSIWKDIGWNTIVYLAAMTTIDPAQYEAAEIDGANRFKRMMYITLPGIKSVIIVLLIMNIGYLLESGFEPQYLLGNGLNVDYSENIDIFVLKYGIAQSNFSLSIAAGMFKTVVSFILLFAANTLAKRMGESRLF
ncbi:ABC transporter permease subunit [Paenibacillus sp. LHD-117]|uniref:ABC transporter permease n=1 Tax=Paenibacillus sp. LHD-117 TaxID=3071412 RepID=UPI0027E10938|nr:ABC transporter permease subunit [Paenibacillus sp. LHD-117]MDQ6417856.1 ABC transporter permease subunit [Paenibacillus sp. LHD-117]